MWVLLTTYLIIRAAKTGGVLSAPSISATETMQLTACMGIPYSGN